VHDEGYVLTAKHVSVEAQNLVAQNPGTGLSLGMALPYEAGQGMVLIRGSFSIVGATVVEDDPVHDIALLQAGANPFKGEVRAPIGTPDGPVMPLHGAAVLDEAKVSDGESVAVSGYPLSEPDLVTTSGAIACAYCHEMHQVPGATRPEMVESYLADVAVNPGNSGGPVYRTTNGGVIGVCVAFKIGAGQVSGTPSPFFYNSGLTVVVPIKYGRELLDRHI
jgi:S1-C subfamily serine protease